MKNIICLDTETTGLDRQKDEILQLSIIDGYGNILFHNLIKPINKTSWYSSEKIHGIKPSDVAGCKPLSFYKKEIENILQRADIIVGYNIMGFDLPMLFNNGIENSVKSGSIIFDVMQHYAYINGEWDNYHSDYRFKKLSDCAAHYGYSGTSWHDALDDAKATLFCFYAICGNPPTIPDRHIGIYFNEDNPEPVKTDNKKKETVAPAPHKRGGMVRIVLGVLFALFSLTGFLVGEISVAAAVLVIGIVLIYFGFKKRSKSAE